jgi:hypothetical protein
MKPKAREENLIIQEIGGEILVYDLQTNKALCLNQTSALVWQNCDGVRNPLEIARRMEKTLGSPIQEDFVWFALSQLKKENLLENDKDLSSPFTGLARREVIKKIGLTSLVALPVVASLVAPTAAQAQTCIHRPQNTPGCLNNGNVNCMANTDCCSCNCQPNGNCTT